jgi:hypothetical protein
MQTSEKKGYPPPPVIQIVMQCYQILSLYCHKAKHKMKIKINTIFNILRYFKFTRIFASKKCNSFDDFGVGTMKPIS